MTLKNVLGRLHAAHKKDDKEKLKRPSVMLPRLKTHRMRNMKFAQRTDNSKDTSDQELIEFDRPIKYNNAEISTLKDLQKHISLDAESSITKHRNRQATNHVQQNDADVSIHQRKAIKAVEEEWKKRLEGVRPQGEYFKQSMGDFFLFLTKVD